MCYGRRANSTLVETVSSRDPAHETSNPDFLNWGPRHKARILLNSSGMLLQNPSATQLIIRQLSLKFVVLIMTS